MEAKSNSAPSLQFLLLCLVLLTVGFRVVHLAADPPGDLDWSGGYFADEGYWSHNARNAVLFGNPVQDEWDGRAMSPLFTSFQAFVFRLFGVGILQVRIVGIFSAVVLSLAAFFLVRRHGENTAFLCAVLVSLNFPLLVLARQGILDPFAAALAWSALALACASGAVAAFLAGVLLVGACSSKFLMVFAFVPVLAAMATASSAGTRRLVFFAAGVSLSAAAWLLLVYLPHHEMLLAYNRFYASQQAQSWGLTEVLKNVAQQPFYLYAVKSPALLLLGNLMLWYFLARPREAGTVERACSMWLICGILYFAVWRYRPLRYYTSLLPPLAVLAGLALSRLDAVAAAVQRPAGRLLIMLGLAAPAAQIAFVLVDRLARLGHVPAQLGIHTADAAIFVALSALALLLLLFHPQRLHWIKIAFFAGFLLCDLRNYTSWMLQPQFYATQISHDLETRIGKGVLSGQWAPELVLENHVKAVPVWKEFVNSREPFLRFGITHLVLWRYPLGDEVEKFREWYPEDLKRFRLVARYTIKDSDLELYQREDLP